MPYAEWLEKTVKEMFEVYPVSISMQMIGADGKVYTCYWQVTQNDRAIMISAMKDDGFIELLRSNKELVNEILSEEDGDDKD